MIYGDKQFRKVYIQTAANSAARASAGLLADGEVQAFNVSGTGLAASGERFKIFTNVAGVINGSDIIDPDKMLAATSVNYASDSNKVLNLAIPATVVADASYELRLFVRDWGNKSSYDYVTVYGQYIAKAGDTPTIIAAGLAAGLNLSLTKVTTTKVTASSSTSNVVITGSNDDFKVFQFDGKPVDFEVSLTNPIAIEATVTTARKNGKGEGYDIKQLEHFSKMLTGDAYAESEISYNAPLLSDENKTYDVVEISYYSERQSAPGDKQRKVVTIAADATMDVADVNAQLIGPLNTIFGLADLT
jgi:hypothetical protein